MTQQATWDAQYRVLEDEDPQEPDLIIGQDDFATAGRAAGATTVARNPDGMLSLAERVQQPGVGVVEAAFIAAPAVYGASLGRTPGERALFAGLGAAVGIAAYELAASQGWVEG